MLGRLTIAIIAETNVLDPQAVSLQYNIFILNLGFVLSYSTNDDLVKKKTYQYIVLTI